MNTKKNSETSSMNSNTLNHNIAVILCDVVYQQVKRYFPIKSYVLNEGTAHFRPFVWDEGIAHFLANLRHHADLSNVNWQKALSAAECFYAEEKDNE